MRKLYTVSSGKTVPTGSERAAKPMAFGLGFLLMVCIVGVSHSTLAAQKGGSQASGIVKFSNLVAYSNERKGGDSVYRYNGYPTLSDVGYSNGRHGGDSVYRYNGYPTLSDVGYSTERKGGDSVYRYNGSPALSDVGYSNGRHGGDSIGRYSAPIENELGDARMNGSAKWVITAYPNPTHGDLQVKIVGTESGIDAAYTISVTDPFGKQLQASALQSPFGAMDTRIDLSGYASGIYMVTVESGNERVVARVLKQ